jgi:hypothetical protein
MKKIFFSLMLVLFVVAIGYSQTQSSNLEKTRLGICGTAELVDGQAIIVFDQNENTQSVIVSLTPVEGYMELYIAKKEKGRIVIKAMNTTDGMFDYVIYEKMIVTAPTNQKNK